MVYLLLSLISCVTSQEQDRPKAIMIDPLPRDDT